MELTQREKNIGLIVWLALSFVVAVIGGYASINAGEFYEKLMQPNWAPPAWVFGPVWTILYLLMGFSAWLVWKQGGFGPARKVLVLYLMQLCLNAAWTWFFFVGESGSVSMVDILMLWLLLLVTLVGFWRIDTLAGILLLPYLAWVTYATFLTYAMWNLNPVVLG